MPPRVLASGPKPCGGNNLWVTMISLQSNNLWVTMVSLQSNNLWVTMVSLQSNNKLKNLGSFPTKK